MGVKDRRAEEGADVTRGMVGHFAASRLVQG